MAEPLLTPQFVFVKTLPGHNWLCSHFIQHIIQEYASEEPKLEYTVSESRQDSERGFASRQEPGADAQLMNQPCLSQEIMQHTHTFNFF